MTSAKTTSDPSTKFSPALVEACRSQFPGLSREEHGQPVVFFDGPAGTQVPRCVGDAMTHYLYHTNANHNGQFSTSVESDDRLREAHLAHAEFVGAKDGEEVAFGQNMTSLTFAFSRALGRTWKPGDEIIVSSLDHDANVTPWHVAAEQAGATVRLVGFRPDDYTLDLDDLANKLNDRTKLVAVGCACNATGGINPVKRIGQMAHQVGAQVFLDAVHYGPHGLIDVVDWDCDFLACSDYKFFGPHLGMLWGRRELLESLEPYKVRPASDELPTRWMTGTQSHESISGGVACIDYLADIGRQTGAPQDAGRRKALIAAFEAIVDYEKFLSSKLISGLQQIDGLEIFGITDLNRLEQRFPTFSIRHPKISSRELARRLGQRGIFVWSGNFYALEFANQLEVGPEGLVRIGLVHYNTAPEIDRLLVEIKHALGSAGQ
ncbi:MAG: cysteine desulfurase family protein (TIGR01976 family) [Mariniblastus sp.]|jgi:cysteine desulfurase family protein (TIGR01976 family)